MLSVKVYFYLIYIYRKMEFIVFLLSKPRERRGGLGKNSRRRALTLILMYTRFGRKRKLKYEKKYPLYYTTRGFTPSFSQLTILVAFEIHEKVTIKVPLFGFRFVHAKCILEKMWFVKGCGGVGCGVWVCED